MNKKFFGGFLLGILCTVLVCTVIACGKTNWKLPQKENNGEELLGQLEKKSYQEKIESLISLLDAYYIDDIDPDALAEGLYAGLVNSLGDVYTTYYTKDEFAAFSESASGTYAGLGSTVSQDLEGRIMFVKPFEGGPASKAGILPGDFLVEINGESVAGMDLSTAVSKIKGKAGTSVELTIYREGEPDYLKMTVVREFIEVPTVEYEMIEDIGYIYVLEFDEVTQKQFLAAVDDLTAQGMKGLVVDLRDNPGGMLTTVCKMLSRIVPKDQLLVYMEDKYERRETYVSDSDKTVDVPIAVLMNGNSASASEVFAGALQDYGLATLVGTQSFGKGIVQSIVPLQDGSAVKVTVSRYFTPNGVCIHGVGLTPDIEVELDESLKGKPSITHEEDNQLQAALKHLKQQIQ